MGNQQPILNRKRDAIDEAIEYFENQAGSNSVHSNQSPKFSQGQQEGNKKDLEFVKLDLKNGSYSGFFCKQTQTREGNGTMR